MRRQRHGHPGLSSIHGTGTVLPSDFADGRPGPVGEGPAPDNLADAPDSGRRPFAERVLP